MQEPSVIINGMNGYNPKQNSKKNLKGSDEVAEKIMIRNGDTFVPFYIYKCGSCRAELPESYPKEKCEGGIYYCGECAFKLGIIDDREYVENYLYFIALDGVRACVKDNEIHVTTSKFPWERTSRDRACKEYKEWRLSVFERDNFTCVSCGQVGGTLNAHHIKEYAKYPQFRYSLENGVTLCEKCHKKVHKKRGEIIGGTQNVYKKNN